MVNKGGIPTEIAKKLGFKRVFLFDNMKKALQIIVALFYLQFYLLLVIID